MTKTPQLENGYVKIANELYEAIMKTQLNGYDRRVLDAIIRKTYGYNKKDDFISLSQIADLTQIKRPHVSRSLEKLKKIGIVTKLGTSTKIGTKLSINKDYNSWVVTKLGTSTKSLKSVTKLGNKVLPNQAPQNTIKYNIQKIESTPSLNEDVLISISKHYQVPLAFVKSKYEDLIIWYENNKSTRKTKGRNWKLTLMKWVKDDAIKLKTQKGGIADARGIV